MTGGKALDRWGETTTDSESSQKQDMLSLRRNSLLRLPITTQNSRCTGSGFPENLLECQDSNIVDTFALDLLELLDVWGKMSD